jgi:hypothetical protein
MLINKGIDVNIKDKSGETALHIGLYKIKLIMIKIHIKCYLLIITNSIACAKGLKNEVVYLIQNTNLEATNNHGESPLLIGKIHYNQALFE